MNMKRIVRQLFTLLLFILSFAVTCFGQETLVDPDHGSAGTFSGKTVLVSIFTNDASTHWNYDLDEDNRTAWDTLDQLKHATDYLTKVAGLYGRDVSFVYDWNENDDLYYWAVFDEELVRYDGGMYWEQDKWLKAHIDTDALLRKYDADNIIFMFFFNTDYSNQVNSWSLGHYNGDYIKLEFMNVYCKFKNGRMPNASYAHEILHAFGAADLYYANNRIPQAYVDHLQASASNDIMYTVCGSDEITNDFTPLDAYYVGIGPKPAEVDEWGLGPSEHDN